ncbi:hypothetical protein N7533_010670 [Penicillium manginii]|uniref:uncharacterized protein n=1 Tax=Penicillium manginii TaxID=203109 RepID=UPI0025487A80|nr:uncharacterized protein N7533_010670 [Penicillium manginii]KAJ5741261.1 hypothetical protein N7533_010670 [Penicillium manginii]
MAPEEREQQHHQQHAEQKQQNQQKKEEEPLNSLQVVGGLTNFLRITAPDTDISTWETRLEVVESDRVVIDSHVCEYVDPTAHGTEPTGEETDEDDEVVELQQLEKELLEAQIGVEEVETEEPCCKVRVMAESLALTLLGRLR